MLMGSRLVAITTEAFQGSSDRSFRAPRPRAQGVGNHQAKLTEREAKEILRARGNCSQASLAARYKVSPALISAIHRGKKWGHLQQQSTSSPPAKGALP
jgi:hypothetical protein